MINLKNVGVFAGSVTVIQEIIIRAAILEITLVGNGGNRALGVPVDLRGIAPEVNGAILILAIHQEGLLTESGEAQDRVTQAEVLAGNGAVPDLATPAAIQEVNGEVQDQMTQAVILAANGEVQTQLALVIIPMASGEVPILVTQAAVLAGNGATQVLMIAVRQATILAASGITPAIIIVIAHPVEAKGIGAALTDNPLRVTKAVAKGISSFFGLIFYQEISS